jgi:thiol-disulfide isomerase/thioredoxin
MLKKIGLILASLVILLTVLSVGMFVLNTAPKVPAVSRDDPATATRPYVVKVHAQWCAVCMVTKGTWAKLQAVYAGRVNLLVFDLTNKETTEASRTEAKRLGLEDFFEAHSGEVGSVYVLDGASKEVKGKISGSRDLAKYSVPIDDLLKSPKN